MTTPSHTPQQSIERSNSTFVFVADHGQLKIFLLDNNHHAPQLRLVREVEFTEARQPLSEDVTGPAGRFPNLGTEGQGNSTAERGGLELEHKARAIRAMSDEIVSSLERARPREWHLIAPSDVEQRLMERLPETARKVLGKRITKNLVNVPPQQILPHLN